jgi:hypothetical protein
MKKHALALAVISACGLLPPAFGHELAYSKKDNIKVEVPGDATHWCTTQVQLTISRPAWDNPALLDGLLAKLPFVLGKDCAQAKVQWKAIDAGGKLYASGSGTSANLGVVTLASASAPSGAPAPAQAAADIAATPSVSSAAVAQVPAPATPEPASPVVPAPAAPAGAPTMSPSTPAPASASASTSATASTPAPAPAPASTPASAPAPAPASTPTSAPASTPAPTSVSARPSAAPEPATSPSDVPTAAVPADLGRSLVLENSQLMQITDGSDCKWLISKSAVGEGDGTLAFGTTPAMPCTASGFAQGSFDKLTWKIPNTYRGDTWNRVYVHPSTLMFSKRLEAAVVGKAVSYLSPKADHAVFLLGEIPGRQMKVYLAFDRSGYQVLSPFNSDPYYVAITPNEAFALDPVEYKRVALEVFQLVKATSPTTTDVENLYIAKSLPGLFANGGYGDDQQRIVRNRIGENRGSLYFDVQQGINWTLQRDQQRVREERRQLQQMAQIHTRVLARYEQLQAGMKDYQGRETEALAQMAGIQVRFASPLSQQDPATSARVQPMMVHVTGTQGDFYTIDFPGKGRLVADQAFSEGWYVAPVANMTPYLALEDGRAIPTYRAYSVGTAQACKQARCADRVSFGAVLAKEFPEAGIDFSWTSEVSQTHVTNWNNASAQVQ